MEIDQTYRRANAIAKNREIEKSGRLPIPLPSIKWGKSTQIVKYFKIFQETVSRIDL